MFEWLESFQSRDVERGPTQSWVQSCDSLYVRELLSNFSCTGAETQNALSNVKSDDLESYNITSGERSNTSESFLFLMSHSRNIPYPVNQKNIFVVKSKVCSCWFAKDVTICSWHSQSMIVSHDCSLQSI